MAEIKIVDTTDFNVQRVSGIPPAYIEEFYKQVVYSVLQVGKITLIVIFPLIKPKSPHVG